MSKAEIRSESCHSLSIGRIKRSTNYLIGNPASHFEVVHFFHRNNAERSGQPAVFCETWQDKSKQGTEGGTAKSPLQPASLTDSGNTEYGSSQQQSQQPQILSWVAKQVCQREQQHGKDDQNDHHAA